MRRHWPAIGVFALVACGRPNPGFKLIGEGDGGDSDSVSASSVGSTDSGVVTGTPTTTTTGMTGTSDSQGSMSAGSATTEPVSTTSPAGEWKYPPAADCIEKPEEQEIDTRAAAADTFFVNETGGALMVCSFADPMGPGCLDIDFSSIPAFQLFLTPNPDDPVDDNISIYAMRFAQPMDDTTGVSKPVEPASVIKAIARIRLYKPAVEANEWAGMLEARRFVADDTWMTADDVEPFALCQSPAASYHCRICNEGSEPLTTCTEGGGTEWTAKLPYDPNQLDEYYKEDLPPEPAPGGTVDVEIEFSGDDVGWLVHDGLMLKPAAFMKEKVVGVQALEMGEFTKLEVHYCRPYWNPF